jgi:hypothetical protein
MPRKRVYASDAAKQAAYRERRAAVMAEASAGWTDKELGQAARDLHLALEQEAASGNHDAELLVGATPAETLQRLQHRHSPVKWPTF